MTDTDTKNPDAERQMALLGLDVFDRDIKNAAVKALGYIHTFKHILRAALAQSQPPDGEK